jgi:hypothetical protein
MGMKKAQAAGEKARKIQEDLIAQKAAEAATPPEEVLSADPVTPLADPPVVAQPVVPATPAPVAVEETADAWKQRYLTLQGKYNGEVPAMQAKNSALEAQLVKATMDIENMQATLATMVETETARRASGAEVVIDSADLKVLEDQYPEIHKGVKAQINASVAAAIKEAMANVKPLEGEVRQIKQDIGANKKQEFFEYLDRHAPEWEQINVRPDWLAWLNEIEPLIGQNRRTLLKHAYDALDGKRAAGFFNTFKEKSNGAGAAPASPDSVEVHPASGGGGSPPTPPKPKGEVITRKFIAEFYRDKTRGKYTVEQAAAIEKKINLAVSRSEVRG